MSNLQKLHLFLYKCIGLDYQRTVALIKLENAEKYLGECFCSTASFQSRRYLFPEQSEALHILNRAYLNIALED